ncbi:MAG: GDSL-type esterase/lipase family protein [Gemmiger sp.]|nr:GDSL-type esterase/lipase family protein [Gemmiger sp.]
MPNQQGGYGGDPSRRPGRTGRQVKAPGTGSIRPGAAAPRADQPARPPAPPPVPDEVTRRTQEFKDTYGFDPPREFTESWQRAYTQATQERANPAPPPAPGPGSPPTRHRAQPQRPPMTEAQARAAARRARERRRARQRLTVLGTAVCVLGLAGVITLLLPKTNTRLNTGAATSESSSALTQSMVAPQPYAGSGQGTEAQAAKDWGTVGPVRQVDSYTLAAAPAAPGPTLPAFGKVTTGWFADAAFLGDSLTVGLAYYDINVGGALICGYEGTSPNQIVNRTTLTNDERGEEIPLDVLAAAPPAKLYVLLGTNALVGTGNDEGFLNYYALMLDALKETLPNTTLFVQSVLPVRPEALEDAPGLTPERLATINDGIRQLCAEKGCYYLNLTEALAGEDGYLQAEIAQTDGIHLTPSGYAAWVSYLCTHLPYNKNNPYQPGSAYYLTDTIRQLLADLP